MIKQGTELDLTSPDVVLVGERVTSNEIDSYTKQLAANDKSKRLGTLLKAWEDQQTEERSMRKTAAVTLFCFLAGQAILVNLAFFLLGIDLLKVDPWTARLFIMAVFSEIAAMSFWVVKYLFPIGRGELLKVLEKL